MIFTEEAKQLIIAFGLNQTAITLASNRTRGIPKSMARRERKLVADLLRAITGKKPTEEDVDDVIKNLS